MWVDDESVGVRAWAARGCSPGRAALGRWLCRAMRRCSLQRTRCLHNAVAQLNHHRLRWLLGTAVAVLTACITPAALGASGPTFVRVPGLAFSLTPSSTEPYAACPPTLHGMACQAIVFPNSTPAARADASPPSASMEPATVCNYEREPKCGDGPGGGYSPSDLRAAYRLPSVADGSGQTVAIVDAFDDPSAESDMNSYRAYYGISACTTESGCFTKVNEQGKTSYPKTEKEWAGEISLDLDMVSAVCPNCHILLVEANSEEAKDLSIAEDEAVVLGATEISNSYGGEEARMGQAGETSQNKYYEHPGIPITAAAGDYGYDNEQRCPKEGGELHCGTSPSFPAASANVISVGATVLKPEETSSRGWSEEVSRDSGGGCSLYESKPKWQVDTKCKNRTDNDASALGDLSSAPVSVYDSFEHKAPWLLYGGTSVGSPIVAAAIALEPSSLRSLAAKGIYENPGNWFDITTGSNWYKINCESYLCNAGSGYDGPSGVGAPDGGAAAVLPPGRPAVVSESGGSQYVYFRAANGALLEDHWNASTKTWTLNELAGATPGKPGDPDAVLESGGNRDVYFRGSSGAVWQDRWSASEAKWTLSELAGTAAAGDPTAVLESNGDRDVYFRASKGAIWQERWLASESKWKLTELGGTAYGEPAAVVLPNGSQSVFFKGTSEGFASQLKWNPKTGEWTLLGIQGAVAKNLTAIPNSSGEPLLFYRGSFDPSGEIGEQRQTKDAWPWTFIAFDGAGEPAATLQANGNPVVFVPNVGGGISEIAYNEGSWSLAEACNGPCQLPTWGITTTPKPPETASSYLWGVSCPSSGACTAVGEYAREKASNTYLTLAEAWNGSEWLLQSTPNPGGAANSALRGVSCTSSSLCAAVGYYQNSSGIYFALGEGWNGAEWQLQSTPEPAGAGNSVLNGVACPAPAGCTAVGTYEDSAGVDMPFAEGWNGVKWSLQTMPAPTGGKGINPNGVACAATTACMAVGEYKNSSSVYVPFAESWNGVKWAEQSLPVPSGATHTWMNGVSCSSASACTAAGYYEGSSAYLPFAERWNGTEWSLQTLPTASGSSDTFIDGVSCPTASSCTASGVTLNSSGQYVTLAEHWNGSEWVVQSTPNVEGKGWLSGGVACASATWCAAVGNTGVALAEVYR
jgi:hypothetical protein